MHKMFQPGKRVLATAVLLAAGALAATAAQAATPSIHVSHGIEYMSGGIGSDEAHFMQTVSPQWSATMEFAVKDAADRQGADFAANVHVQVLDAAGHAVLDTVSEGPFLLTRLAPGHYDVQATFNGQTLKQALTVQAGTPSKNLFVWPASALRS
ncbi:hypothetical protein RD110_11165 [Rhodoferax koreense]|uniref:Carboxypeptidase regulatory-like domain-containing protein n=1 Tax=Rhodoferax koreensis TaxID=1842727 RepID=A0A1P8JV77_9BURK|nr:carboxypeptidase-like regulatory domain-containing protein [Rhodoferax koreense]APW37686.1 hypothetical protein RD110_11165 [Rhodoferax koreense]